MTKLYNKKLLSGIRKKLRHNMPKAEVILWSRLKNKSLLGLKFRRQYSVGNYVLDFYCPVLRLGIEVDGQTHENTTDYDARRQLFIETFNIKIIRFNNIDVYKNLDLVINEIARFNDHPDLSVTPPY